MTTTGNGDWFNNMAPEDNPLNMTQAEIEAWCVENYLPYNFFGLSVDERRKAMYAAHKMGNNYD